jgi:hypothetical protein
VLKHQRFNLLLKKQINVLVLETVREWHVIAIAVVPMVASGGASFPFY